MSEEKKNEIVEVSDSGKNEDTPAMPVEEVSEETVPQDKINPTDIEEDEDSTFLDDLNLLSMNYVELTALEKDLKKNRDSLSSTFETFNHMKTLYSDADSLKEAFENAIESDPSLESDREEMDKFIDNAAQYEEYCKKTLAKFDRSISRLEEYINSKFGNVKKTMSFWDDQTLDYLKKLKEETTRKLGGPNLTAREIQRYRDIISNTDAKLKAMEDRFDLSFWMTRSTMTSHVKRIEKDVRKDFMKSLQESMWEISRFNSGIDSKSFMTLYVELARIIPYPDTSMTSNEKNLAAMMFLASIAKVGKNPNTVLYSSRLLNMIFSMQGNLYDYDGDHDAEHMKEILRKILHNYLDTTSSVTKKMYERFEHSMKKGK